MVNFDPHQDQDTCLSSSEPPEIINNNSHPSAFSEHLFIKHYSVIPETIPPPKEMIILRIHFLPRTSSTEISSFVQNRVATTANSINFYLHLWSALCCQVIPHFIHYNNPYSSLTVIESGSNPSCNQG